MKCRKYKRVYLICDCTALLLAWFTYSGFRYLLLPLESVYGNFWGFISSPRPLMGQFLYPAVFLFIFYFSGHFMQPASFVAKIFAGVFVESNRTQNVGYVEQKIIKN